MNLSGILLYSGRAFAFAFAATLIWACYIAVRGRNHENAMGKKEFLSRLLLVFYLSALIQITVIREWGSFFAFFQKSHNLLRVQLIPFKTTLEELVRGPWPFCYHLIGNMIWFVPLGFLAPAVSHRFKDWKGLLSLAFCLSGAIEVLQWCFATGVSDVDDIFLNGLGALFGLMAGFLFQNRKNLAGSFAIAFSMYSRIPMPLVEWTGERLAYTMCFFPLIGVVIGLMEFMVILFCQRFQFPYAGKLIPVALPVLVTGGIHMDGFLDVVDACSSHGEREKKLEILKDPHTGAFAIIGCSLYFILYTAAFGEMGSKLLPAYCLVFFITRALSGLSVVTFPMAKKSGLAYAFSDAARKRTVGKVMKGYLCFAFVFLWFISGPVPAITSAFVSFLIYWHYYTFSMREFGGITGDLAGYFLQTCELALVAGLAIISHF